MYRKCVPSLSMKYLPSSSFVTLCLPENIAASMELGSEQRVSMDVSNNTPPTLSLTILGNGYLLSIKCVIL